jgi:hypothetical protein
MIIGTALQAQSWTSTEVLQSTWKDTLWLAAVNGQSFFNSKSLRLPRLEEFEFRTETHNFDPERQEYAVRLQLNSSRQIKTQAQLNTLQQARYSIFQQQVQQDLLLERYRLLLELYAIEQETVWNEQQDTLLKDLEQIASINLQESGENALDDWLALQDDRMELDRRRRKQQEQRASILAQLGIIARASIPAIDFSTWPSPEILWNQGQLLFGNVQPHSLSLEDQKLSVLETDQEKEMEDAENKNLLTYLQLRYTGDDDPLFRDRLTLGAGLRLPFRNAQDVKVQYLELKQLQEEQDALRLQQMIKQEWQKTLKAWEVAWTQWQATSQTLDDYQANYAPERLLDQGVRNPKSLLQAQKSLQKRRALALEDRINFYQRFLDVLKLSGYLGQSQQQNWWSTNFESLSVDN